MGSSQAVNPQFREEDLEIDSEGYAKFKRVVAPSIQMLGPIWFPTGEDPPIVPPSTPISVLRPGELLGCVATAAQGIGLRDIIGHMKLNGNDVGPEMRILESGSPLPAFVELDSPVPFASHNELHGSFSADGPSPTGNAVALYFLVRWSE